MNKLAQKVLDPFNESLQHIAETKKTETHGGTEHIHGLENNIKITLP